MLSEISLRKQPGLFADVPPVENQKFLLLMPCFQNRNVSAQSLDIFMCRTGETLKKKEGSPTNPFMLTVFLQTLVVIEFSASASDWNSKWRYFRGSAYSRIYWNRFPERKKREYKGSNR